VWLQRLHQLYCVYDPWMQLVLDASTDGRSETEAAAAAAAAVVAVS